VILSAAAIWVFIKLPQEYWIHIAQKDMTDAIKETLFGVDPTASWGTAVGNRPAVLVAMIAAVAILVFVVYWIATRKAPPGDHRIRLKADPLPPECQGAELYRTAKAAEGLFDRALLEKVVLTGLVSVIFAQYMLSDDVRSVSVLAFVAVFVAVNALVSQWLARRGREWRSVGVELVGMFLVNYAIVVGLQVAQRVLGLIETRTPLGLSLFFVFLFTVITVLFDRYRTVLTARGVLAKRADEAA
jgi:ABC-type glycerol-3-phosphate transport system permease component